MKIPRRRFLHLAAGLSHYQPSRASQRHKPIRRGRYAGSSSIRQVAQPTQWPGSWGNGCRTGWGNQW